MKMLVNSCISELDRIGMRESTVVVTDTTIASPSKSPHHTSPSCHSHITVTSSMQGNEVSDVLGHLPKHINDPRGKVPTNINAVLGTLF